MTASQIIPARSSVLTFDIGGMAGTTISHCSPSPIFITPQNLEVLGFKTCQISFFSFQLFAFLASSFKSANAKIMALKFKYQKREEIPSSFAKASTFAAASANGTTDRPVANILRIGLWVSKTQYLDSMVIPHPFSLFVRVVRVFRGRPLLPALL